MQLCRLAPPGTKPSALASYAPWTSPMNSLITLRWNHGGRNVCSATIQRGGKITKSTLATPGGVRRRGQHSEDRRVGMIEADRVDDVEAREVVLVRRVVAVPGDDVERRMVDLRRHRLPQNFATSSSGAVDVLVRGDRRQEVARVGEPVRADRAELGQAERRAVILADIAARRAVAGDRRRKRGRAESRRSRPARPRARRTR